jgi:hypothetical protein
MIGRRLLRVWLGLAHDAGWWAGIDRNPSADDRVNGPLNSRVVHDHFQPQLGEPRPKSPIQASPA